MASPYLVRRRTASHYTNPFPLASALPERRRAREADTAAAAEPHRPAGPRGQRAQSLRGIEPARRHSSFLAPARRPAASLRAPSPPPTFIPLRPIRSHVPSPAAACCDDDDFPPRYASSPPLPSPRLHPRPDQHDLTQLPPSSSVLSPPPSTDNSPVPFPSFVFPSDADPASPTTDASLRRPAPTHSATAPLPSPPPSLHEPSTDGGPFPSDTVRSKTSSLDSRASTSSSSGTADRQRYRSQLSRSHSSVTPISAPSSGKSISGRLQAIRKKIESELSRKRTTSTFPAGQQQQQQQQSSKRASKAKKGTVAGLKPSPALTVPESMSVADASQLCAAKRSDCVLVVDEEEGLSGIFTAKDLAFRVTAESLDPRTTPVSAIMTKNPMVTRDSTSATEALQLMVSRGFRHLPVCNEEGDVVGLLDITKVFHEALAKVERGSSASAQLSAALAGVQSEIGPGMSANPQAAAMLAYVESLREKMALPDLTTILDPAKPPATVGPRTSVREAAQLMKERRTTAVCVMEVVGGQSKIVGIFTSKDVVLRVIAAGLDSQRCSVVRVMTPHPDTAPPTMFVQDALKKMHNGHYLNLPVVEDGRLVGIVDVLKLTYATLEQIGTMNGDSGSDSGGPMWGKFFDSLGGAQDEDAQSVNSGSHAQAASLQTPKKPPHGRNDSFASSAMPEVLPSDSASAVGAAESDVGARGPASSTAPPAVVLVDDGTYVFKFKTPSGRTHRFQARSDMLDNLREIVVGKLASDPFFAAGADAPAGDDEPPAITPGADDFTLSYTDDDGDLVHMTSDSDVVDSVKVARAQKTDRVVLVLSGGKSWEAAIKAQAPAPAPVPAPAAILSPPAPPQQRALPVLSEEEIETGAGAGASTLALKEKLTAAAVEPASEPALAPPAKVHTHINDAPAAAAAPELIAGIPKDLVLPASIGFLGVVIIAVFAASRMSK